MKGGRAAEPPTYFEAVAFTSEDRNRSDQYIANADREALLQSSTSVDEYLGSLQMSVVFGPFTPVAVGDYAAGPSHVLPTGGTARWASGLNVNDFRKRTSILRFTRKGLQENAWIPVMARPRIRACTSWVPS